ESPTVEPRFGGIARTVAVAVEVRHAAGSGELHDSKVDSGDDLPGRDLDVPGPVWARFGRARKARKHTRQIARNLEARCHGKPRDSARQFGVRGGGTALAIPLLQECAIDAATVQQFWG